MICEICGKEGARVGRASRTYGKGKDMCGESYLEAETLHETERIRVRKKGVTTPEHWSYDV